MLVLSRKQGEEILIGKNTILKVQRIAPGRVRLSIEAPRDVLILRGELLARDVHPATLEADMAMDMTVSLSESGVS